MKPVAEAIYRLLLMGAQYDYMQGVEQAPKDHDAMLVLNPAYAPMSGGSFLYLPQDFIRRLRDKRFSSASPTILPTIEEVHKSCASRTLCLTDRGMSIGLLGIVGKEAILATTIFGPEVIANIFGEAGMALYQSAKQGGWLVDGRDHEDAVEHFCSQIRGSDTSVAGVPLHAEWLTVFEGDNILQSPGGTS